MKFQATRCNECGKTKPEPSAPWFEVLVVSRRAGAANQSATVRFEVGDIDWERAFRMRSEHDVDVRDICGAECLRKHIDKLASQLYGGRTNGAESDRGESGK